MRTRLFVSAVAVLVLMMTGPAAGSGWEPSAAGWRSSPTVEHLGTLPVEGGAIGAVRHGKKLVVAGARSFSIYDVREPAEPSLLSTTPVAHVLSEHPDTNGRILLLSFDSGVALAARSLEIWDISEPRSPRRLAGVSPVVQGVPPTTQHSNHTWACVLDCTYAYGSAGTIVDLRDPAAPSIVGDWRTALDPRPTRFHGIDEVAPGVVLTASEPTVALDARTSPAAPAVLAQVDPPVSTAGVADRRSIPSYAHWPLETTERFALETIETPFSGRCDAESGGLVTYDTTGYQETGRFAIADVHRFTANGTFTDGNPPANAAGCSAFGLAESPDWTEDRLVAVAAMEHGLRLLRVDDAGQIEEVGGFMGHGTEAAVPAWGTRRVLYVADLTRGVDVLRVR